LGAVAPNRQHALYYSFSGRGGEAEKDVCEALFEVIGRGSCSFREGAPLSSQVMSQRFW
jgi:hypothetical protein